MFARALCHENKSFLTTTFCCVDNTTNVAADEIAYKTDLDLRISLTSCGGTSKDTVLRSTFVYESVHGMMKKSPATHTALSSSANYTTTASFIKDYY